MAVLVGCCEFLGCVGRAGLSLSEGSAGKGGCALALLRVAALGTFLCRDSWELSQPLLPCTRNRILY